jgi:hypothetical protein
MLFCLRLQRGCGPPPVAGVILLLKRIVLLMYRASLRPPQPKTSGKWVCLCIVYGAGFDGVGAFAGLRRSRKRSGAGLFEIHCPIRKIQRDEMPRQESQSKRILAPSHSDMYLRVLCAPPNTLGHRPSPTEQRKHPTQSVTLNRAVFDKAIEMTTGVNQ